MNAQQPETRGVGLPGRRPAGVPDGVSEGLAEGIPDRDERARHAVHDEIATRAYAAMRYLVLDQGDARREVAETLGMSFVRAKALRRLAITPMRMSELAASMGTDKPYATLVVDDLESRGLVARTVDPSDRRAKIVAVTDAGRLAAATADAILSRPAPGLERLSEEELRTLERLVAKAAADDDGLSPELRMSGNG
jgi:DNA-binding MarR family transcriptional regulator